MNIDFSSSWTIGGIITERREIKSDKNATWRGYRLKVAALGLSFELSTDEALFGKVAVGTPYKFVGHYSMNNKGFIQFDCTGAVEQIDAPASSVKRSA